MSESKQFKVVYKGNVEAFEEQILNNSDQEVRIDKPGLWCNIADETPPSIKKIDKNTLCSNFFRWGINGGRTGNHRIIYAMHNFHKVILLHHFDKRYNGLIRRNDLIPAEWSYEDYCMDDPNLYEGERR